jgi:hypothetical protein
MRRSPVSQAGHNELMVVEDVALGCLHQEALLPRDRWKDLVQQEDQEHRLIAVAEEAP